MQLKGNTIDAPRTALQESAAQGVASADSELPHRDRIQTAFGAHDIGGVRAQIGGLAAEACASIGAEAYATGNRVAFAGPPDLHTAAHEAAHVVQQRAGVHLKGGVGEAGDRYEQQADAVADLVVQGKSAEYLLGTVSSSVCSADAVQCWNAREHRDLGNEGSGKAMVALAPDYKIPFGEVTALGGDHFSSIEQMREFAKKAGGPQSREEIEYARMWKGFIPKVDAIWKNESIKEAQQGRYFGLAGNNVSHFLNSREGDDRKHPGARAGDARSYISADRKTPPPGGSQAYRMNHVWAIKEAVEAGKAGRGVDEAMAVEAFGSHFLTDAFAAGHVRTERLSIKEYWDKKVPMFPHNLEHYLASRIAENLDTFQENPIVTNAPVIGSLTKGQGTIRNRLKKSWHSCTFSGSASGSHWRPGGHLPLPTGARAVCA